MKKIKISLKDSNKLEFLLDEDAIKGDFISLNDLNQVNFDVLKNEIENLKNEKFNEILEKEKQNYLNEFKLSDEYVDKDKNIKQLEKTITDLKLEFNEKKANFEIEINKVRSSAINDFMSSDDYKNKIQHIKTLEIENTQLKERNKLSKDNIINEYKLSDEFIKLKNDRDDLLVKLNSRSNFSSKQIGEDLEKWIQNEYDNNFGLLGDCSLTKITKNSGKSNSKADFLFQVFDNDEKKNVIESVVIEAKSESSVSNSPQKNENHYKKLDEDRKNQNAKFALLVSELEKNNSFLIKKVNKHDDVVYDDMYVIRPEFFITFLSMIRTLALKEKEINIEIVKFKNKQFVINEFNEIKEKLLNSKIGKINVSTNEILKQSNSIISSANKIKDNAEQIINKILKNFEKKVNEFNIQKVINNAYDKLDPSDID